MPFYVRIFESFLFFTHLLLIISFIFCCHLVPTFVDFLNLYDSNCVSDI